MSVTLPKPHTAEHLPLDQFALTPARLRALLAGIAKPAGDEACWLWSGRQNTTGYPSFGHMPVYRIAYEWLVGPIPSGMELDHLCRTPHCVNPHHLEPVTRGENLRRIRLHGPWQLRRYCRRGHALIGANRRVWSDGGGVTKVRCYACHDWLRQTGTGA